MTSLLNFDHVSRDFDEGRIVALHDVSFDLERGRSVAVIGASGSGKTTLLMLMCGIMLPSSGQIRWDGEAIDDRAHWTALRRHEIGIVFQDFNLFPTLTAAENIEIAMLGTVGSGQDRARKVEQALDAVGLSARAGHLPHQLSGGERQRVAIARSLVNDPILILADEPTGNLDSISGEAIMSLLLDLHASRGVSLVIVTHNHDHARRCADQIRIQDGRVLSQALRQPQEASR
jgi:ABC-type lipoprotein export system ATPase subunit